MPRPSKNNTRRTENTFNAVSLDKSSAGINLFDGLQSIEKISIQDVLLVFACGILIVSAVQIHMYYRRTSVQPYGQNQNITGNICTFTHGDMFLCGMNPREHCSADQNSQMAFLLSWIFSAIYIFCYLAYSTINYIDRKS